MDQKLAIFASGSGTNAENLIKYFSDHKDISVDLVITNNPDAYVIQRAKSHNITCHIIDRKDFYDAEKLSQVLTDVKIDWIILAGFLWLIPEFLVSAFPNKIINIHPALLPKYGGKGMYGHRVHQSVFDNFDTETGITVHYVNEAYDEGQIIFQAKTSLELRDTPDVIAQKIHELEYAHFPQVIEKEITK